MRYSTGIGDFLLVAAWAVGVSLVKGFWMTAITAIIFPIAWVVTAQYLLDKFVK